jgi:transposase-like protein
MTSTTEISEVLKTDAKGRVRVPKERRAALLDEFERSGLSGAKFAAHYGLKYPSFAGWVQQRRRERGAPAPAAGGVRWLEALTEPPVAAAALTLHLPGGARLEITGSAQVPLAAALMSLFSLRPSLDFLSGSTVTGRPERGRSVRGRRRQGRGW